MSWAVIRSVRKTADVRLIAPFGLGIRVGDVIRVDGDGNFSLEGSTESLLGVARPTDAELRPGTGIDAAWTSGRNTQLRFHTNLKADTSLAAVFPGLPEGCAGFDVSFESADSWLLALAGRNLLTFPETNRYRRAILDAHKRGAWEQDWALVYEVAYAEKMTFVASEDDRTKVALALSGEVPAGEVLSAQLTAGISVAAANKRIVRAISSVAGPVGCRALRICDEWWRFHPKVGSLEEIARADDSAASDDSDGADDEKAWQDIDYLRTKADEADVDVAEP